MRPSLIKQPEKCMLLSAVHMDGYPQTIASSNFNDSAFNCMDNDFVAKGYANVFCFCITEEGNSLLLVVKNYRPWTRIEVPSHWNEGDVETLRIELQNLLKRDSTVELKYEKLKRFYGFIPDPLNNSEAKKFMYAKFSFTTWKSMQIASNYLTKKGLEITEKQVKPLSKFMFDTQINPSEWIALKNLITIDTEYLKYSNCQSEYEIDCKDVVHLKCDIIPPLLILSFDGEMYSEDGTFPDPLKGDSTIYIGANFWIYGTDKISKHILCVGEVPNIPTDTTINVSIFEDSRKLIEGFRDLLITYDPDFITGWNIYGFDYSFLHQDYQNYYLHSEQRGSENLQLALLNLARSCCNLDPISNILTSAALFNKFRIKKGYQLTKIWIEQAEKKYGYKPIRELLKQEKLLLPNNSLVDLEEEEDGGCIDAFSAFEIRMALRKELFMPPIVPTNFKTVLSNATTDQTNNFWIQVKKIYGKSVLSMLQMQKINGCQRGFYLGRFASEKSSLSEKRMTSSAKGDNTYYFWSMCGRINVDLMQIIKDDKKPEDNTLKFASKLWLKEKEDEKIDLSAEKMFDIYRQVKNRWEIAQYCCRDCDIPLRIIKKLSYVPSWMEMSRVCFTWANEIVNSGQQIKVFNLITKFIWNEYALNIRDSGWPQNDFDEDSNKKRPADYQGATVIEPKGGFYEDCISTLDFESLYPSIIRYFNLCPSVLILDDFPDVQQEIHTITHNIMQKDNSYKTQEKYYAFAKNTKGVLPVLLKRLLEARKSVKQLMNATTDSLQKEILNGRQNGIKVACNSVYGFCGVSSDRGLLPCKPVAAVTTLKGRAFIEAAKSYVENNYKGSDVIYGDTDSVMIFWGKGVSILEASQKGIEASNAITLLLRSGGVANLGGAGDSSSHENFKEACSAVTLAYEKTYMPYLLLKKKNYAGLKHTFDKNGCLKTELDMKGIDAIRRDRPKLLRDASNSLLNTLLYEKSVAKCIENLKSTLTKLTVMENIEDFVLSKSLKSNYTSTNLPHVNAWNRMIKRGDNDIPPIGSRMPFVVVVDKAGGGGKKSLTKMYERTEHPDFVKKSNLKIDRQYYVETLQNPLTKLLQYVVEESVLKNIFRDAIEKASLKVSNIQSLSGFKTELMNKEDEFVTSKKRKMNLFDF